MQSVTPYRAIADPTRRRILDALRELGPLLAGEIAALFPNISRPGISRHLRVLRQARLIRQHQSDDKRQRRYMIDAQPLQEINQWLAHYETYWQSRLDALKQLAEDQPRPDQQR